MTILWLVFLLQAARAGKITKEENWKLKERCSKSAVAANMYKRYRVDQSKYPFVFALSEIDDVDGSHSEPFCSGVLISSRHILTAAHCLVMNDEEACKQRSQGQLHLQETPAQEVGVFQSSCSTKECWTKKQVYEVALVRIHQNYDVDEACDNRTTHDIGMIELKQDISDFKPICMPQEHDIIPQRLISIGYGEHSKDYSIQAVVYESVEEGPEMNSLLAYTKRRNESTIHGDSGGPLLQIRAGKYYLVGITSTSTEPPAEEFEGLFVDVRKKLDWICDETGVCPLTDSEERKQPPSEEEESF
ncbi:unnamed protein product [Cylicocyclus nassatus]|uniref:Peptidase S1 domain-containing protein n=1 Tax=Cylicocyclus nassatus TaxID=53992 RepID=A0AA36GMA1_CYLNA|nr:unnamed protein product [Cylicocyclus nassatus]